MSLPVEKMKRQKFKFTTDQATAKYNWEVLSSYDLNLEKALEDSKDTQLQYRLEFKDVKYLKSIFKNHPLWNRMEKHLSEGCLYPLSHLDVEKEKQDAT